MNKERIIDALGEIDSELIQEVDMLRGRVRRPIWIQMAAMAACFVLIVAVAGFVWRYVPFLDSGNINPSTEPTVTQPVDIFSPASLDGVYVNSIIYMPDTELSQVATEKNVGDFVGYVSLDNKTVTTVRAFNYLPDDGETAGVVILHDGHYYVYVFECYVPDGTDSWPAKLLEKAANAEIQEVDIQGKIVESFLIEDDAELTALLSMLAELGEKRNQTELKQRYYERFKDCFPAGSLWLGENGWLYTKDAGLSVRLSHMISEGERRIRIIMEDQTHLRYTYFPAAGVLLCDDFGYFLSDVQMEQINQLVDLK